MGKIILGVVLTIVVVLIAGAGMALLGLMPTRSNVAPPDWERNLAMSAMDNSVDRHAAHTNNPVPPTDENLIAGAKIYTMNCALCHGDIDRKPSALGRSFYPPAPNLVTDPVDDPEWHVYFIVHNGVRYTGMPAWDKTLSETDMWKVVGFVTRIEKLPQGVQDFLKQSGGAAPPPESTEHHDHAHH